MKRESPQQRPGGAASLRTRPAVASTCGGNDGCARNRGQACPLEPGCPFRSGIALDLSWEKAAYWTAAGTRQPYRVPWIREPLRYFSFQESTVGLPAATNKRRSELARRKRECLVPGY